MPYFIGIDLGTSSLKVILLNQDFEIIDNITRDYNLYYPQSGWVEQHPREWTEALNTALKDVIANNNLYNQKFAVGVTGQMHGVVPLGTKGEVLYPALNWSDRRTKTEVDFIKDKLTSEQLQRLSNPVVHGFSAPKILWLMNNQELLKNKMDKILMPKDYIIFKLTGNYATDESEASGTLLFDIKRRKWDSEVLDTLGIPARYLPEVKEPGTFIGQIKTSIKDKLGLKQEIPVIAAGGDAPLAALANGVVESDRAIISMGTSGQIITSLEDYKLDPDFRLHTMCHGIPGKWYIMAAMKATGFCIQWWNNILEQKEEDISELTEKAYKKSKTGGKGIIFLPYLNNGERSPHLDSLAAGNLFGILGEHKTSDITRAIMEGVGFAFRQNLGTYLRILGYSIAEMN